MRYTNRRILYFTLQCAPFTSMLDISTIQLYVHCESGLI